MSEELIPWFDLMRSTLLVRDDVLKEIQRVYDSGHFTGGPEVEAFENAFAGYLNTEHVVAVNNGTNALHLALLALGIGQGDEVIVVANGFIAAPWAVCYVRAKPVMVDCLPDTWQIDPQKVESALTASTKAIVALHLYGQPCNLGSLKAIADQRGIAVVEDTAHAHGAKLNGQMVGAIGDVGCFSFYPTKNLGTAGEGGALVLKDPNMAHRVRALRNNASEEPYIHKELGYNMRMGETEAAVLRVKLKHLDSWNAERKKLASLYMAELKNNKIRLQFQPECSESVHHLFVIQTEGRLRDSLSEHLLKNGFKQECTIPCHVISNPHMPI